MTKEKAMNLNHKFGYLYNLSIKKNLFLFISLFHALVSILAYWYAQNHIADANKYWNYTLSISELTEHNISPLRENFIYFINHFLAEILNLRKSFGFILYSGIGLLGIWYFYKTIQGFRITPNLYYLALGILFFPSMHFWTSMIGKEPICFLGISMVFFTLSKNNSHKSLLTIGFVLLLLLRPHVAIILGASVLFSYLIIDQKLKILPIFIFIGLSILGLVILLNSHWIQGLSIESFQYLLQVHHDAFRKTNSYVPLEDYNIFYKIFTFYFRPMPFEYNTLWGWFSGIENILSLLVFIGGIYSISQLILKHKYKLGKLEISIIFFFLLLAGVLTLAYSNFGLISRMKNQSLPYMLMLCIYWISIYFNNKLYDKT